VSDTDWYAIFKQTLEADLPESTMTPEQVDVLIADIIAGRIEIPDVPRPRRSRRRWIAAGAAITVLGGGTAVAALWNGAKPTHPEAGIACRASADPKGDAAVLPPARDPLAACAQLWLTGVLPDLDHASPATDVAPPLFACVDPGGALDVFPNLADPPISCTDLGLVAADTDLIDDPRVVLQDRLVNDINLQPCVDLNTARQLALKALADLGLTDWTVTVRDSVKDCVKGGEDSDTKSVFLFSVPN
jgi:hypothetical protein